MRHNGGDPNLNSKEYSHLLRTLFQGKWRLRLLQEMIGGPVRLSQLRRAIPDCSKKVLIDTARTGGDGLGEPPRIWHQAQESGVLHHRRVECTASRSHFIHYGLRPGFQEAGLVCRAEVVNMGSVGLPHRSPRFQSFLPDAPCFRGSAC